MVNRERAGPLDIDAPVGGGALACNSLVQPSILTAVAKDRFDYDAPYGPRRYGNDEECDRDFWRNREPRSRGPAARDPLRR